MDFETNKKKLGIFEKMYQPVISNPIHAKHLNRKNRWQEMYLSCREEDITEWYDNNHPYTSYYKFDNCVAIDITHTEGFVMKGAVFSLIVPYKGFIVNFLGAKGVHLDVFKGKHLKIKFKRCNTHSWELNPNIEAILITDLENKKFVKIDDI